MLQENIHGSNTVSSSKVIRIDLEVWAELQRRAIPFKDNPDKIEWLLNDFTAMFGTYRKASNGQEHTEYDKAPTVTNDALMAKGFSTAAFQLWKRNNLDNESFVTYN